MSRVADIITIFSGDLLFLKWENGLPIRVFVTPNRISVARLLSWASSRTTTLYFESSWSSRNPFNKQPSVMYFILVEELEQSSNLTWYPTSSPSLARILKATLWATDMAATLRGWDTAMTLSLPNPPSYSTGELHCLAAPSLSCNNNTLR